MENCSITYSLTITKLDGSAVGFTLNDSNTTFIVKTNVPSLTWS